MADVIWCRVGDGDSYHPFDSLDEVADYLRAAEVVAIWRHCRYGVAADGYTGQNYISLYHGPNPGDGSAEPSQELTGGELEQLNQYLAEER